MLKYFSERIPATFVYAGIDVERNGLLSGHPRRADRRALRHGPDQPRSPAASTGPG